MAMPTPLMKQSNPSKKVISRLNTRKKQHNMR